MGGTSAVLEGGETGCLTWRWPTFKNNKSLQWSLVTQSEKLNTNQVKFHHNNVDNKRVT